MSLHRQRQHPEYVEGCFACKVSTLRLAPSVASSTAWGARAAADKAREKRWDRDMPAYKRLRNQGFQPPHIDGSADLETNATTRFEIESGRAYPGQEKKVAEAVDFVEQGTGRSVFEPAVTPKKAG